MASKKRRALSAELVAAVKFFQAHAGGVVGERAKGALQLARAEAWAEREGVEFEVQDDPEGERDYQDRRGEWRTFEGDVVGITARHPDGRVASLWGIHESGNNRERDAYRRVVCAELAMELQGAARGNPRYAPDLVYAKRSGLKPRTVKVGGYRATRYKRNPRGLPKGWTVQQAPVSMLPTRHPRWFVMDETGDPIGPGFDTYEKARDNMVRHLRERRERERSAHGNPANQAADAARIVAWWKRRSAKRLAADESEAALVEIMDQIVDMGNANVGAHRDQLDDAGYAVSRALHIKRPSLYD